MNQFITQLQTTKTQALLFSSNDSLIQELSNQLSQTGVKLHTNPQQDITSNHYTYIIIDGIDQLSAHRNLILKNLHPNTKICLVLNVNRDPHSLNPINSIDLATIRSQIPQEPNLRIVKLHYAINSTQQLFFQSLIGQCSPENQTKTIYPLSQKDASTAIIKSLLKPNTAGKVFEIAGLPTNVINLNLSISQKPEYLKTDQPTNSHDYQSFVYNQNLLNFRPNKVKLKELLHLLDPVPEPPPKNHLIQPQNLSTSTQPPNPTFSPHQNTQTVSIEKTNLNKSGFSIAKTFSFSNTKKILTSPPSNQTSTPLVPKKTQPTPTKKKLHKTRNALIVSILIATILLFLWIVTSVYLFVDLRSSIQTPLESLLNGNLHNTPEIVQKLEKKYSRLYKVTIQPIYFLSNISPQTHKDLGELIDFTNTTVEMLQYSADTYQSSLTTFNLITSKETGDLKKSLSLTQSNIDQTYHKLSILKANSNSLETNSLIQALNLNQKWEQGSQLIEVLHPIFYQAQRIMSQSEWLLGLQGKKTYLVLLQNSAELRPTGGFIGSYALVTFEQGKLIDVHVEDVYTADGQLRGHVEPPPEIKKYLGEAGWFLRDVNWDPNFPTTAIRAAWFLEKEMGQTVDGVVGINIFTIKNILRETGPIDIPDYNEKISASNFFERVEYQVEINQFPGSTQKRDFLGQLARSLVDLVINQDKINIGQLAKATLNSINQNHLFVYVSNPRTQEILDEINLSGKLQPIVCPQSIKSSTCFADYLMMVEANVGVNKANYFVSKSAALTTTITPQGHLKHNLTINYKNISPSNTWPGGTYKNYLRLYTPPNTILEKITVDQNEYHLDQVDRVSQHNRNIFGLLLEIKPQTNSSVVISYKQSQPITTNYPTGYSFNLQKQSGTKPLQFKYTLHLPENLILIDSNTGSKHDSNTYNLDKTLDHDLNLQFELVK